MQIWLPLIAISVIFGFLPLWLIITISVPVGIVAAISWWVLITKGKQLDLAVFIPLAGALCGTIGLIIMWATYFAVTHLSIAVH